MPGIAKAFQRRGDGCAYRKRPKTTQSCREMQCDRPRRYRRTGGNPHRHIAEKTVGQQKSVILRLEGKSGARDRTSEALKLHTPEHRKPAITIQAGRVSRS